MKYRFVLFPVIAALACRGDRSYSSGPSAMIQDALNGSGNPFFFWLPPILQQQPPTGQVFSGLLLPTVSITDLCTNTVIHTFSGSDVQIASGKFQVNWHTAADSLNAACNYRIAVTAGSQQLGVADVDIADSGNELKNVDTDQYIALLDDRTLPIQFFIGVGSLCQRVNSDCGEGTLQPGQSSTIVTENGQAGAFFPAGAVDQPVTIIIESADDRPCIAGLLEPVYSGSTGPVGNSCYDFHTDPPLSAINASGKFNSNVTVGICADVAGLDHATRDLLQIFQLHPGADPAIRALNNVPAPFLSCDPGYPLLGSRRSLIGNLAARLAGLFLPQPLYARSIAAFDVGAGGSADMFSRFTWALPSEIDMNFDAAPDLSAILPGTPINTAYSHIGVTFSRTQTLTSLCPGTSVYANDYGPQGFGSGQNNISVCPLGVASDFSEFGYGDIVASFAVPAAQACISATPTGFHNIFPGGVAFIEAIDSSGNVISRTESTTERVQQRLCVSGNGTGVAGVRFAGAGAAYAIFDNLTWSRVPPGS